MNIPWNRTLLTLGVTLALAAPPAALAHQGGSTGGDNQAQSGSSHSGETESGALPGSDSSAGEHGSTEDTPGSDSSGSGHGSAGHGDRNSSRSSTSSGGNDANRTQTYNLRGTVVSVDPTAGTLVVLVKKATHGRRGRGFVNQTITFDVTAARIDVKDVNGDGSRDLSDVAQGDSIEVRADLPRSGGADLTAPVAAKRVKDRTRHDDANGTHPEDAANHG
jgi:hypothetical protein